MIAEEPLAGGGVNEVVRAGDTVRRPAAPWTPAVHGLLDHLAARGFTGAPRAHGLDERGREILDYLPGTVAHYPAPAWTWSDATLRAVAALLRDYHDATAGYVPPADAIWQFAPKEPAEVICHGDVAPYNCVFRDGVPVAFIDFDTAHPAPRLWDVAYAAYRFVPITTGGHGEDPLPVTEQIRRLRLFCDAYGLPEADRRALPDTLVRALRALAGLIRERAAAGDAAFAAHLADGHPELYLADARHVRRYAF
ncbi:phosphotransferase enzyme family protein [Nonomuraea sp. SBT364]|uniref:phosphotransferase enzyme family protein n=1 Tax=Nonomuraea sp. SBT364 TaxID=1580530 RepID=UPI000B097DCC|nr:phosphotransferase [Nonomuraea sp. SBT364]